MTSTVETRDIVIVGSGPAGCSTALNLARDAPHLAKRTVVLEKEHHPRHKLCGGGLTPITQRHIARLELDVDVPFLLINEVRLRFRGRDIVSSSPGVIQIVRRNEFDAALVQIVRDRGIEVREGVVVTGLEVDSEGALVRTNQGMLRAKAVVGADGAKSVLRRHAGLNQEPSRICRALEVLTPENVETTPEFRSGIIMVDLTCILNGVQGYYWDFPSLIDGEPHMNRGIFDARIFPERPNADLKAVLRRYLAERGRDLEDLSLQGNPGRWFDSGAQFSAPHVLLAGDAAGIEPFGGDGISCAFGYGEVVAAELAQAFASSDYGFQAYGKHLIESDFGGYLAGQVRRAKFLYGVRNPQLMWLMWTGLYLRSLRRSVNVFAKR